MVQVSFEFRGEPIKDEDGLDTEARAPTIFRAVPRELELKVDETQELTVFAVPTSDGYVNDTLVCTIENNPDPAVFRVAAVGVTPSVKVDREDLGTARLLLLPQTHNLDADAARYARASTELTAVCPLRRAGFQRLLVDHSETLHLTIHNECLLPVKFAVADVGNLPQEFTWSTTEGVVDAQSDLVVSLTFTGKEKAVYDTKVVLEIRDAEDRLGVVVQSVELPLKAEAYKIEVDMKFPGEGSELDFGLVRVLEDSLKTMSIANTGKYEVGYRFRIKGAAMRELFTITPQEGAIEPGKEQQVEIHFNRERSLNREVTLKGDTSISLAIIETLTGRKETATFIKVNLRAVFTKYTLSPPGGINFGPLMYNTTSNPRVFEIVNTGEFPFQVAVASYGDEAAAAPTESASPTKGGKEDKKGGGKGGDVAAKELKQGNFTITPSGATVEPGTTLKVEVTFEVVAQRTYVELLAIHITDRDPNDHPGGIPYEVAGESCIPGIVTEDYMSIFEEHKLVASLDILDVENNVFAMRDRVFNFGAVIAHMGGEAAAAAAREVAAAAGEVEAAGGSIQAPPTKPVLPGVQANLKVTNCNKVPCTINLSMKARGAAMPAGEVHPMDIQPKQLTLPPHEYRYVTVYFTPQRMQRYAASLDVVVDNGSDPRTKQFTCEVRGEGTLPHVMVEAPDALDDAGRPMLTFPRLLLGKTHTLPVTLRNNGIIAATARLEMGPSDAFSLPSGLSSNVVLEPKRTHTFQVVFKPAATKKFAHELQLMIKHNSFETQSIALAGECYQEDVTFEGLPRELDDELHFEDGAVGTSREVGFTLRNHTDKAFRFWWPRVSPHLTFSPRRGHLHGKGTMAVVVAFHPAEAAALSPLEELGLVMEELTYEGDHAEPPEWDDRMTTVKYVPLDHEQPPEPEDPPRPSAAPAGGKGGKDAKAPPPVPAPAKPAAEVEVVDGENGEQLKRIEVVEVEPAHTVVPGTAREIGLKVFAVADNARYEASVSSVTFRPTMMFQARSFGFSLKNTSTAKMELAWSLHQPDGTPVVEGDASTPYTVLPLTGTVEAGQTTQVSVRFAPQEVDEFPRLLNCTIPNLDAGYKPLSIPLRGKVMRPWCHFELPESDYLTAGRRNPELAGPGGSLSSLDPATRTLEFESLGTRTKNLKRFFILNPTNMSYEFVWEPVAGAPGELPTVSPFRCLTKKGVIMGGKRYEILFEYTPDRDDIFESFWRFRIPEQDISVPFLLVGMVTEPNVTLDRAGLNFNKVCPPPTAHTMLGSLLRNPRIQKLRIGPWGISGGR